MDPNAIPSPPHSKRGEQQAGKIRAQLKVFFNLSFHLRTTEGFLEYPRSFRSAEMAARAEKVVMWVEERGIDSSRSGEGG